MIRRKLAVLFAAPTLAAAALPLTSCTAPAPQCDFYVSWVDNETANYTAACIGGTPTWGVPGFATGWQVAYTSAPELLSASWQAWGIPAWYNPGTAVYFSQNNYLSCEPNRTYWYRPVLGTEILNGFPQHVSSYGSPRRIVCGSGFLLKPGDKRKVETTMRLFPTKTG